MTVRPAKTQIRSAQIRVFAMRSMGSWGPNASSCGQWRLWSDWADAQADLSLRWAQSRFVGFVMSRLKCSNHKLQSFHWIITRKKLSSNCHMFMFSAKVGWLNLRGSFWSDFHMSFVTVNKWSRSQNGCHFLPLSNLCFPQRLIYNPPINYSDIVQTIYVTLLHWKQD